MVLESSSAPSAQPNSGYNYVVTAQKPTAVRSSAVGHFSSPDDINLIISKTTRIEIYTLAVGLLEGLTSVPIYGRIAYMELFRPPGKDKDLLFLLTETHQFSVLEYDTSTGEVATRAEGDASAKVGRINENGSMGMVDPQCRMIGLHIYDAIIKIIPVGEQGRLLEAFDVRIDEMCVTDVKFLDGTPAPTLAVLYVDPQRDVHIKTYTVSLKDKAFSEGPWSHSNLDAGATMIIPVPAPLGGAIVVGESVITYFSKGELKTVPLEQTTVRAYGRVDEDGSRYLLGDLVGNLYLLVLNHDGRRVLGLKLQSLGRTSAPSSIAYLDNAVVYIGSSTGDSQLVRLHPEAVDPEQPSNFVELMETFTNLGPIVDMCVVDLDRQGQCQVVTCSGARTDGSLRIVRNGIGMVGQATVELPGIRGIWSLRAAFDDSHDSLLVLTFVGETRLLAINEDDELEEAEPEGFDADAQSLYCGNTVGDTLVQVTPKGVRLLSAAGKQLVHEWRAPGGQQVNIANGNASQVLLACGEGNLVLLEVADRQLEELGSTRLSKDVACVDVTPLQPGESAATLAAVGTWDHAVHLLRIPDLSTVRSEPLGVDVIPRSILFSTLEGVSYLLVALGDGQLFNFRLQPDSGELSERKKISLGTKPITLSAFRSSGSAYVFAASDRPTVIYSSSQKLLYSNLNEDEVNFMAPFNSRSFPDSLALAKEGCLTIGTIDEVQKLHIRSVPLGSQPRRMCHLPTSHAFFVVTDDSGAGGGDNSTLHLLDEQTFEAMDRFTLDATEQGCSICTARFADDPTDYVALGTAYVLPEEPEPSKGRVLIFQAKEGKLRLVAQKHVNGAVFTIAAFQGKLLLGCNSRVQIFKWTRQEDSTYDLSNECTHKGHVLAVYIVCRGDFIVVGDLMRSIDVLVYKPEEGVLEPRARDFNSAWMTAVEILDDDTYLGADNSYNLFSVRKNADAANDEERGRLEVIGEYHLGDMVNRFQHGSLVMQLADSETARIPTVLFGTLTGAIGVVASLPPDTFALLEKLQSAIRKVIKGVGGLDHTAWRLRKNERGVLGCRNFVDGDLVEQFLDLKKEGMQKVVDIMGGDVSVEELTRLVEELSRSLH